MMYVKDLNPGSVFYGRILKAYTEWFVPGIFIKMHGVYFHRECADGYKILPKKTSRLLNILYGDQ